MPVRARANKVTKPAQRDSRQSSLSSNATPEQLEQFALQASSSVGHNSDIHSHSHSHSQNNEPPHLGAPVAADHHVVDDGNGGLDAAVHLSSVSVNMLANGASIAGIHDSLQHGLPRSPSEDFDMGGRSSPLDQSHSQSQSESQSQSQGLSETQSQPHGQSQSQNQDEKYDQNLGSAPADMTTAQTAAEVALAAYGDLVKIDSALCKKLAQEIALREPTQRRRDQKLNIERRSNVEALLAHVTGEPAQRPCKNCHKGHGPWTQCVVYDGQMCGSCTNCWFNASGSRCTFHENNHPQPQSIYTPSLPAVARPSPLLHPHPSGIITYQQQRQQQQQQPPPPPSAVSHASPVSIHLAPLQADVNQWGLTDPTRQLVSQAMDEVATYSRRSRYIARIEAAAKELGMRIAEYDEYLRSPEGMIEQQGAVALEQHTHNRGGMDRASSQEQIQGHAPEAHMGEAVVHAGVMS